MKITKEWLKEKSACREGYEWSLKALNDKPMEAKKFIKLLVKEERFQWANWVIVRLFTKEQNVKYAIFAAEQVIHIYEKKYPDDKRPRKAIESAKAWLENPTDENKRAAYAAYAAAADAAAADAAYAAADAAYAAADAAYAAAYADAAAAAAADAAAAYAAAADAADADDARKEMRIKIINYGLEVLEKGLV